MEYNILNFSFLIKNTNLVTKYKNQTFQYSQNITLIVSKHDRNFFLSPTTMALLMHGNIFLMVSSMMIGGTFSPPAVIISSLMRPVTCGRKKQSCIFLNIKD